MSSPNVYANENRSKQLPPWDHPDRFDVRYVSANGSICWNWPWVNVSPTCAGEYATLKESAEGRARSVTTAGEFPPSPQRTIWVTAGVSSAL
jgi:hypothetical protein